MRQPCCTGKYISVKRAREFFSNFLVAGANIQAHLYYLISFMNGEGILKLIRLYNLKKMQSETTTGRKKRDFAQASGVRGCKHTAYPRGHRDSRAALSRSVKGASKIFLLLYLLTFCELYALHPRERKQAGILK